MSRPHSASTSPQHAHEHVAWAIEPRGHLGSRKPPTGTDVRDDDDLEATQASIEAQLAAIQEGYERIKKQLAERRALDAALRGLLGLGKRTTKVEVKPRVPAARKRKP